MTSTVSVPAATCLVPVTTSIVCSRVTMIGSVILARFGDTTASAERSKLEPATILTSLRASRTPDCSTMTEPAVNWLREMVSESSWLSDQVVETPAAALMRPPDWTVPVTVRDSTAFSTTLAGLATNPSISALVPSRCTEVFPRTTASRSTDRSAPRRSIVADVWCLPLTSRCVEALTARDRVELTSWLF